MFIVLLKHYIASCAHYSFNYVIQCAFDTQYDIILHVLAIVVGNSW